MDVFKLAAFSQSGQGGNPADVAFYDALPGNKAMLKIARNMGSDKR